MDNQQKLNYIKTFARPKFPKNKNFEQELLIHQDYILNNEFNEDELHEFLMEILIKYE